MKCMAINKKIKKDGTEFYQVIKSIRKDGKRYQAKRHVATIEEANYIEQKLELELYSKAYATNYATIRKCIICKQYKQLEEFNKEKWDYLGYTHVCKDCSADPNIGQVLTKRARSRRSSLKRKYGMTTEDYYKRLKVQKGTCAICHSPTPNNKNHSFFSVDHCHATGKVRGLLCNSCNMRLNNIDSSPEGLKLLEATLEYIKKSMRT